MSSSTTAARQLPVARRITSNDDAAIAKFAKITTEAFGSMPLLNAFVCDQENIPPPYPYAIPWPRRLEHFEPGLTALIKNGAETVEAGDWSALALWQAPDYKGPGFGELRTRQSSLTIELGQKLTAAEHRLLDVKNEKTGKTELRPAYFLSFISRNPSIPSVPGAIRAVILPFLERARNEGIPAWLEAANIHSMEVYKHYGFRVVEPVTVGIGKHNADGWPTEGGEGVTVWVMVYDAHLTKLE